MNRETFRRIGDIAILVGLLFLVSVKKASAYIDAGSGSYLFQLMIAGAVGILYSIKLFWKNIRTGVRNRLSGRSDKTENNG